MSGPQRGQTPRAGGDRPRQSLVPAGTGPVSLIVNVAKPLAQTLVKPIRLRETFLSLRFVLPVCKIGGA